jgi:hypothetical protein
LALQIPLEVPAQQSGFVLQWPPVALQTHEPDVQIFEQQSLGCVQLCGVPPTVLQTH